MPSSMWSGKRGWAGPCWRLELLFGTEAAISMDSIINAMFFSAAPEPLPSPRAPVLPGARR